MFGWTNGWPFQWGGGPTEAELIYRAMRSSVGEGGAGPVDGIEDCWRQARAIGLEAANSGALRAALQAFPGHATDALPYYEAALGLASTGSIAERQRAAEAAWTQSLAGVIPSILEALQELDDAAQILQTPWESGTTTQDGKYFEPRDLSEPFNFASGQTITNWPAYSDAYRVSAVLPGADPTETGPATLSKLAKAAELLGDALPAWMDFQVVTAVGFTLDSSPLDLTGLLDP